MFCPDLSTRSGGGDISTVPASTTTTLRPSHPSSRRSWLRVTALSAAVLLTIWWRIELGATPWAAPPEGESRRRLPDTCQCRALFTVGGCGLATMGEKRAWDSGWTRAVAGLGRARQARDMPMMPHLATLSRYLPQAFTLNVTEVGVGDSQPQVSAETAKKRVSHVLPFLPCRLHLYQPGDVLACARRHLADTGAPLRLAFVGDSRVRNTMEAMIRHTRHALSLAQVTPGSDHTVLDDSLTFLDSKAHFNVPVVGEGLELRLHWSAFLHKSRSSPLGEVSKQGARDLLEAWASGHPGPRDGPVPDVVYVTSGLWDTSLETEDNAVSDFLHTLQVMAPVLHALAARTHVLWHVHGPIKPWIAPRDVPNSALDMMNRLAWARLDGGRVWLWDSRTVLTIRQHHECRRLYQAGLHKLAPKWWGCLDFQHAGQDVEEAAGNMLWNLACNQRLGLPPDLCCATQDQQPLHYPSQPPPPYGAFPTTP